MTPRALLLESFAAALAAVDGRHAVDRALQRHPLLGAWHVLAIGKAAGAMAQGAVAALGSRVVDGLAVLPAGYMPHGFDAATHGIDPVYSSHPLPDERSLEAGAKVMEYVARLPPDAALLCLISGGASSLVDALMPGKTLDDLQSLNRWALQSGAPIAEINAARRQHSRLKGGGLARLAGERRLQALMISDVPGDDPRVIGSGLLHGDATTREVPVRIVASIAHACRAAAAAARDRGLRTRIVRARLAGDAARFGTRIASSLARQPPGVLQVRGGESTVRLPENPGRGGRNQHLALAAALEFERLQLQGAYLLAAGTDGIDGASDDAGALVDAGTCLRARDAGCDAYQSLARADSGTLLDAAGDLLHTGPTATNVGDLVLTLRDGWQR
jgi:hydroxypyruvate reductase